MSWPCPKCTFKNSSATTSQCTVCGYNKKNTKSTPQELTTPVGWHCSVCGQRNSSSTHKCRSCFSEDLADFNEMVMANTVLSPSHSAPNPSNPIASRYDVVVERSTAVADADDDDVHPTPTAHTAHTHGQQTASSSSSTATAGGSTARSSSLTRTHRNSEIFDLYTNKKKSLLPIDINFITSIGRKPKLGAPPIKMHFDEEFNLSTSTSPSSTTHAPKPLSSSSSHSRSLSYSQSHTLAQMASTKRPFFDKADGFSSQSPTPPPPPRLSSLSSQLGSSDAITMSQSLDLDANARKKTPTPTAATMSNQNALDINVTSLGSLPLLPLQQPMVRKYSDDPLDPLAVTTTVLFAPQNSDDCGLQSALQRVSRIEHKMAHIVQQRRDDDAYYRRIVMKMRRRQRHSVLHMQETMAAAVANGDVEVDAARTLQLLTCEGCQHSMTRAKCAADHHKSTLLKCHQCKQNIGALGGVGVGVVEYYHCPNVQLSLHREVGGRDLCALCGVQQMIRQDAHDGGAVHEDQEDEDAADDMELDTDTEARIIDMHTNTNTSTDDVLLQHDNFLHYQTHKLGHILPVIARISELCEFEPIYDALYAQTQQFGARWQHDTDVLSLLRADRSVLQRQIDKTRVELQKSKSNKTEIEHESTQIASQLSQVDAELASLLKRVTAVRHKKHDLEAQMHGLADVLHAMYTREQQLHDASAQTALLEQTMRQRIERVEAYNEKVRAVQHALLQQRRVLCGEWDSWDTSHVLAQLQRYLSGNALELRQGHTVMHEFETRGIAGKDLRNLNPLTLRMMHITEAHDQRVLLNWIASLTTSTAKHHNDADDAPEHKTEIATQNEAAAKTKHKDDELLCAICMHNRVNIILCPCQHICICHECSTKIKKICPVCRGHIDEIKTCFFASR